VQWKTDARIDLALTRRAGADLFFSSRSAPSDSDLSGRLSLKMEMSRSLWEAGVEHKVVPSSRSALRLSRGVLSLREPPKERQLGMLGWESRIPASSLSPAAVVRPWLQIVVANGVFC
jgi:hypothetical protein